MAKTMRLLPISYFCAPLCCALLSLNAIAQEDQPTKSPETADASANTTQAAAAKPELPEIDLQWLKTFKSYPSNGEVISIPLTEKNIKSLRSRFSIYNYQILYVAIDALASDKKPLINIGFYPAGGASGLKQDSQFIFPDQSIRKIDRTEHAQVITALDQFVVDLENNRRLEAAGEKRQPRLNSRYFVFPIGPDSADLFDLVTDDLFATAKSLYVDRRYAEAEVYYRLLSMISTDENLVIWAKELLGVCLEKQKKFDQAAATYTQLQLDHPESSAFKRVDQRLRGLATAASGPESLREASFRGKKRKFFTRGFFGQTYRNVSRSVNDREREDVSTFVTTQFDVRTATEKPEYVINARANGTHISDQLDPKESEFRLKRLFLEYQHRVTGTTAAVGRQKGYDSGVFTSFDGVSAAYPLQQSLKVGFSIGVPVYYADLFEELDYLFYSGFLAWEAGDHWRFNSYWVNQTLNGVTDRRALGLRSQYFSDKIMSSFNLDYDIAFNELNNLLWTSSYKPSEKTSFTLNFGQQRSPFLSASNIFIGQPDLDLKLYLSTQVNRDRLLDEALARTALNTYLTLQVNRELTDNIDINVDLTQSNLSEIPSSSVLLGDPDAPTSQSDYEQTSVGAQLIAQNFLHKSDIFTLGFRSSTSTSSDSIYGYVNERLRFSNKWTLAPKLAFGQNKIDSTGANEHILRVSSALMYKPWRAGELSVEFGNELIKETNREDKINSNYLFAGYRISF